MNVKSYHIKKKTKKTAGAKRCFWSQGSILMRLYGCRYQWDSSWLQARCRGSGVHIVEKTVYLPERDSSSSVADLDTKRIRTMDKWNSLKTIKAKTPLNNTLMMQMCVKFTFIERSSLPRVTFVFTGGNPSLLFSWSSTVALMEFCKHPKSLLTQLSSSPYRIIVLLRINCI